MLDNYCKLSWHNKDVFNNDIETWKVLFIVKSIMGNMNLKLNERIADNSNGKLSLQISQPAVT